MVEVLTVKKAFFLVLAVSLALSFSFAKNLGPSSGTEGLDELVKQKGHFKTTLIRPDADFSKYGKVYPKRVLLQFRGPGPAQDESTAGSLVKKRSRGAAIPDGEDLKTLRQIITDAFVSDLGSCELTELVEEVDQETLSVRFTVMDIVTDIASKSSKSGKNSKPFSVQANIVFDLSDGETGVILARFGERRKSGKADDSVAPPDAGAEWVNIWSWADQATADFHQEMERVLTEDRG
jgi:hypothetical protein